MKEILIAENSGFCFGVKQAIEKTEEQIKIKEDGGIAGNIYTCVPWRQEALELSAQHPRHCPVML